MKNQIVAAFTGFLSLFVSSFAIFLFLFSPSVKSSNSPSLCEQMLAFRFPFESIQDAIGVPVSLRDLNRKKVSLKGWRFDRKIGFIQDLKHANATIEYVLGSGGGAVFRDQNWVIDGDTIGSSKTVFRNKIQDIEEITITDIGGIHQAWTDSSVARFQEILNGENIQGQFFQFGSSLPLLNHEDQLTSLLIRASTMDTAIRLNFRESEGGLFMSSLNKTIEGHILMLDRLHRSITFLGADIRSIGRGSSPMFSDTPEEFEISFNDISWIKF